MPHSKIPFQILLYHPKDDDLYEDPWNVGTRLNRPLG
jgi:hypothetical protein